MQKNEFNKFNLFFCFKTQFIKFDQVHRTIYFKKLSFEHDKSKVQDWWYRCLNTVRGS